MSFAKDAVLTHAAYAGLTDAVPQDEVLTHAAYARLTDAVPQDKVLTHAAYAGLTDAVPQAFTQRQQQHFRDTRRFMR